MIRVSVTGGIGSGKSIICEAFSKLGIPVYYADNEARRLTENDHEIREALISLFGNDIYDNNKLNRPVLAEMIFNNPELLSKVNAIIHPRVARHFELWVSNYKSHPYIIQESALVFESDAYLNFDKIITVTAPEPVRLARVLSRENMTAEKFHAIVKNQLDDEIRISRSDFTIVNDNMTPIIPQILKLHQLFTINESYEEL